MSSSRLSPVRMIDTLHAIFSHLKLPEDKETLCACSLVCELWHPAARKRLFSELTVTPPDHPEPYPELGLHHPAARAEWKNFSIAVKSNISLVTRLRITHNFYTYLRLEDLPYLLPSIPSLRHIALESVWLRVCSSRNATEVSNHSLDSLEFTNATFDLDTLTTYMAFFHLTRSIIFQSAFIYDMAAWVPRMNGTQLLFLESSPSFGPTALSILNTEPLAATLLLDFFNRTPAVHTLRSLTIGFPDKTIMHHAFARLISTLKHLETLEYDSRNEHDQITASEHEVTHAIESFESQFGTILSNNRTLRTFSLRSPDVPADHPWWSLAFFFIQSMPATLDHLELHLGSFLAIDFEELKSATTHFKALKSVKIYADGSAICRMKRESGVESFGAYLHSRLPNLSERGVLQAMIGNY